LKPVPDRDTILNRFNDRMPRSWFGSRSGEYRRKAL